MYVVILVFIVFIVVYVLRFVFFLVIFMWYFVILKIFFGRLCCLSFMRRRKFLFESVFFVRLRGVIFFFG